MNGPVTVKASVVEVEIVLLPVLSRTIGYVIDHWIMILLITSSFVNYLVDNYLIGQSRMTTLKVHGQWLACTFFMIALRARISVKNVPAVGRVEADDLLHLPPHVLQRIQIYVSLCMPQVFVYTN